MNSTQARIVPNTTNQINPQPKKTSEITKSEVVTLTQPNVQYVFRTKEQMKAMFDVIFPNLLHPKSGRLKSEGALLKLIAGRCSKGLEIITQEELGKWIKDYEYNKSLSDRQIKTTIKRLRDLGLINYERSNPKIMKSPYRYTVTELGKDIYWYLLYCNKGATRLEHEEVNKELVDKILKRKIIAFPGKKTAYQKSSTKSVSSKKTARNINIIRINNKRSLSDQSIQEEDIVSKITFSPAQLYLIDNCVKDHGFSSTHRIIFLDEIKKEYGDYLTSRYYNSDKFKVALDSFAKETSEKYYFEVMDKNPLNRPKNSLGASLGDFRSVRGILEGFKELTSKTPLFEGIS